MIRKRLIVTFMLVIVCSIALAKTTPEEWKRLKAGEVIVTEVANVNPDGSQRVDFLAKIFIKASREAIWKVIRDYEKFPEFMPNTQKCKILKQEGETYWVYYEVKVMMVTVHYCLKATGVEKYKRIEFRLDNICPSDIRSTSGYWFLEDAPDGSGTIVHYSTYTDTGIPAPEALAKQAAKKSLPQVVKNVKQRVESGGTWRKPAGS